MECVSGMVYEQRCMLLYFICSLCIAVLNILLDHHCHCKDIFLCPHPGDTGYGVFISDFNSAPQVDRGRKKLKMPKPHCQPVKYSVHGILGYQSPEVGERKASIEYVVQFLYKHIIVLRYGYHSLHGSYMVGCVRAFVIYDMPSVCEDVALILQ